MTPLSINGIYENPQGTNSEFIATTVTQEGIRAINEGLVRTSANYITHMMFLTGYPDTTPVDQVTWNDVKSYLAKNAALVTGSLNLNVVYHNSLEFQAKIDREMDPPPLNAAILVMNGRLDQNQVVEYRESGQEKVFSIVTFDAISKASWADFFARWTININNR